MNAPMSLRLLLLVIAWPAVAFAQSAAPPDLDDLVLVDCKLPAKTRRIGGRIYQTAARPARTTAVDCRIRGGEYTVYDRANYATSLKIWLAEANKGDAEAAYYVAKIYEAQNDHTSAASWYQKAAAKGHSSSQFALGRLYEQGLGVQADSSKAFNLFRDATGLKGNYVFVESVKYAELEKAAEELAIREQEVEKLQQQLDEAKKQQKRDENHERELNRQLEDLKRKSTEQQKEVERVRTVLRNAVQVGPVKTLAAPKNTLGRYYAIVIGNSNYQHLPAMPAAARDADAMTALLRDSYGFQVTTLKNATYRQILTAIFDASQNLAENDNLVVFYAGHGRRDLRNRRGWWLPADAKSDDARTNWLPNQEITDRLALVPARHILVLADGSYVGDITRGAPQPEPEKMTDAQWKAYVQTSSKKKARLALASGTDSANSKFTTALIDVLKKQKGVVPASRIHREVVNILTADQRVSSAVPTYAPLPSAFHDGVDFLFERR